MWWEQRHLIYVVRLQSILHFGFIASTIQIIILPRWTNHLNSLPQISTTYTRTDLWRRGGASADASTSVRVCRCLHQNMIRVKKCFPSPADIPEVNVQTVKGTTTTEKNCLNTVKKKGLVIKGPTACNRWSEYAITSNEVLSHSGTSLPIHASFCKVHNITR